MDRGSLLSYRSHKKAIDQCKKLIDHLKLDLSGFNVLTEVGTNAYMYTPFIAVLAGAEKVNCWTRDSAYGKAEVTIAQASGLARDLGVGDVMNFKNGSFFEDDLKEADIITNSNFLRPLDESKLSLVKNTALILLMYEAWELRSTDLDLSYCNSRGLQVVGTWENDPSIQVFDYVGVLAVKMAFEAGYEILNSNILIWSDDDFGATAKRYFEKNGANVRITIDKGTMDQSLPEIDFIFVCKQNETRPYHELFDLELLASFSVGIVHLYGDFNYKELISYRIPVSPLKDGKPLFMSRTLDYLGSSPALMLAAGSFKAGESVKRNQKLTIAQLVS